MARLNLGGPAVIASVLRRGLDPARFEQRLLVGDVGEGEADFAAVREPDLPVQRVAGLGPAPNVLGDVQALFRLASEIRAFRPHIVHTHTSKAGVLGRLAAWACRVPATVHTFHGHHLHSYFSPAKTAALIQVERVLARGTTHLVAVGDQVRDELLAAGIGRPAQFDVVPPGIELPEAPLRAEARHHLGIADDALVVAFVARLTAVKRPDRFLEVAATVANEHPRAIFLVVGEGPLLAETQAASRVLGADIRFLGWRHDVEAIFAASDLVLLTSDNEGMPVTLIEAALCGVPAVTTRVGSAAEVVVDGETGLLTSTDAAGVSAAVSRLLADTDLRQRMGRAAAIHAHESFAADRLVADMTRIYESIAATKGF